MKKMIPLLFITSIILSACGGMGTAPAIAPPTARAATETPTPVPTAEIVSGLNVNEETLQGLEISVWTPWYGIESTLFDSLVAEFNSTNQWGIQVASQSQINFSNLYEMVTTSLPTADKPDLVIALPEHALEWNNEGVVADLTPYAGDPVYGIDPADFPPAFWDQDVSGEVRVAVPAQRTARFLLWNRTWAGELGFDSAPAAPDDFRQQSCRAQKSMLNDTTSQNDFMGGWIVDTGPFTDYAWLLAFQGGVLDGGNNYRFLTPNNVEALKFLRELSESQCAWQVNETDPVTAFAGREALFITAGLEDLPSVARAFAGAGNTDIWEVIAFPGADRDAFIVYGSSYVILRSTDQKQLAAWLFTRWLLDKEQDKRRVETTHLFPLRISTFELLTDYRKSHPQWVEAVALLTDARTPPRLASWRKVKVMLGDGFEHMVRVALPSGQAAVILAQMDAISGELDQ